MDIEKTMRCAASAQDIWSLLLDPQVMGECVPGMQSIEVISATEYLSEMHVKFSFISAKFKLRTSVVEQRPPHYLRSQGSGEESALASTLKQTSEIFLTEQADGQTELRMKVQVQVLGRLGTFGLSAMKTKADRLWLDFSANLQEKLASSQATAG